MRRGRGVKRREWCETKMRPGLSPARISGKRDGVWLMDNCKPGRTRSVGIVSTAR